MLLADSSVFNDIHARLVLNKKLLLTEHSQADIRKDRMLRPATSKLWAEIGLECYDIAWPRRKAPGRISSPT